MNSLELVRKLYEDDADLDALRKELDEGSREELQHLIEARDALSGLPHQRPSAGVIDAVVSNAMESRAERRPALTLILANRTLQRLAAAAVVVVAVGVGYLTLTNDGLLPVENKETAMVAPESPAVAESSQFAAKDEEVAQNERSEAGAAQEAEPLQRSAPAMAARQKVVGTVTTGEGLATASRDDDMILADAVSGADAGNSIDTVADKARADGRELLSWDDEGEALNTLFWQVRALDGRSPDDKWEEAVPLEGSFERLEKQQPGSNRWLQTGTQR